VDLPLEGISWVIAGGQSGKNARPFHLEWAEQIRDDCHRNHVAFFLKQLGRNPTSGEKPIKLLDAHGGDWSEWPDGLRIRELPLDWRLNN
jgi:protein gp37